MPRQSPRNPVGFRRCVSCRKLFDKASMLRVVKNSDDKTIELIRPNTSQKQPDGRSAYCCDSETCINIAIKGKKLAKALKSPLSDDILHILGS